MLVVRAEDDPHDLTQPRGKQDWEPEPHGIWYHRTTGIWQPVWLEPVADVHIEELRWSPDLDRSALDLSARLTGACADRCGSEFGWHCMIRCSPTTSTRSTADRLTRSIAIDSGADDDAPGGDALVPGAPEPGRRRA